MEKRYETTNQVNNLVIYLNNLPKIYYKQWAATRKIWTIYIRTSNILIRLNVLIFWRSSPWKCCFVLISYEAFFPRLMAKISHDVNNSL